MRFLFFSFVLTLLDRYSKLWAVHNCHEPYMLIPDKLFFQVTYNKGISLGLFNNLFSLITIIVFFITVFLHYYSYQQWRKKRSIEAIKGELLVLIGSWSNLIDRYLYQGVVDFIVFQYSYFVFPVFNVADVAIVTGVIIMMLHTLLREESLAEKVEYEK